MSAKPLDERRLWRTEDCGYDTPCWTWVRFVYRSGYGQYRISRKTWLAHRYFYARCVGPIPEGYEVDHLCRNKRCVNPDHLEAVTPAENSRRSPHTKLTEGAVVAIRAAAPEITSRSLATQYGVHESTISQIRCGIGWDGVGTVPAREPRFCGYCNASLDGVHVNRRFCDSICKSRATEARRPKRERTR